MLSSMSPNEWLPSAGGRHPVDLGPSLVRALKARSGAPPPKQPKNKFPNNDFYSFRYTFKPDSVDESKQGSIEAKSSSKEAGTSFRLERPSTQSDESHAFSGTVQPAKDWECVLIYDEENGTFTLEKLDSSVTWNYEGRVPPSKSTKPTPPSVTPPKIDIDLDAELSAAFGLEDAEGEIDPELEQKPRYEEEEEEEEIPLSAVAASQPIPAPPARKAVTTKANGAKPTPKAKAKPKAEAKGKGKGKGKGKAASAAKKAAEELAAELDQEEFSFSSQPAPKPAKKGRTTQASAAAASSSRSTPLAAKREPPPLALPSSAPPKPSDILLPPSSAPSRTFQSIYEGSSDGSVAHSDSDDDMIPVSTVFPAEEEEEEAVEVDDEAFALELDEHLRDEDDADSNAPPTMHYQNGNRTGPVPLNQYAGNGEEDDYSSSEESDDD
ncbi:hypothetical protein SISNIDRAFT_547066 [Sistotremastrum niveocremeum HHB9708]|uniref:Transcription elongation factor Eaf N-terminal domain-containing protein n=1 Tax=Sistotremastrum niveocremeum HHB9708 TaxID=1314777 RepID=A0A164ZTT4_9AGAM|nr:hypothetical protein SISNIDRAFT_547066 [Sistotremastrum niveocremeum HHB9708]